MKSIFKDEEIRNENADLPWKKSETDKMLNLYFDGATPDRIAVELRRNPKAVNRRIEDFRDNTRGRADCYEPVRRFSRIGARITENEKIFIKAHKRVGVALEITAKVLQRKPEELGQEPAGKRINTILPAIDVIAALRYAYAKFRNRRDVTLLPPDTDYDALVQEECEFGGNGPNFLKLKKMNVEDYPFRIRGLACYLCEVQKDVRSDTL